MGRLPANYFDLAIVDPPYGIGAGARKQMGKRKKESSNSKAKVGKWDDKPPPPRYWRELFRVSKNQIVFGGNYFTRFLPASPGWIFWDKKISHEVSFSSGELIWTSFKRALKKAEIYGMGQSDGTVNGKAKGKIHPTQKPVSLYRWILERYAKGSEHLLDTHVGSASSLIAFEELGFSYQACELDPHYFKDSTQRLNEWRSQIRIPETFSPKKEIEQFQLFN